MATEAHEDQVKAGKIVGGCLKLARELTQRSIGATQLDKQIEEFIRDHGGEPALKGYEPPFSSKPYLHTICLAIGNQVVHGPPHGRIVQPDDLITVDLVVRVNGWHADAARTFTHNTSGKWGKFLADSHTIFMAATSMIRPNLPMPHFGMMVEAMANQHGYQVIKEFCGHGIGQFIHEPPQIINYHDPEDMHLAFAPGKAYAVEPILAQYPYTLRLLEDGWTYEVNCPCTHFEDTFFVGNECILRLTEEN